ncbi:hypothetical protein [Brevundimonas sp.]|jgi:hypothetical protein|uniref:hypothetical protein n=1 Tax=Brevundimonas sp. TaxID=1871086 RepID=UPI0025C092B1|nr:hypothetical protein [Brevundimonas sp.]
MAEIRDQTLTGAQTLDGNTYINCQFSNARLTFQGGQPPGFVNCTFEDTEFVFDGAAGRTMAFLKAMAPASTNMRHIVLGLLPELGVNG